MISAIVGIATAGATFMGGAGVITAVALGVAGTAISNMVMDLTSPDSPDTPDTQKFGTSVTVRDPASTHKIVYGRTRVGGAIIYLDSTGTDNEYNHIVMLVACHEIDGFEEVWFNDEKVWDGSFQGDWGTYVTLSFHKGTQTSADSSLVSASTKWTNAHKVLGHSYLYVRLKYDNEKFASGFPNISALVRGKKVYNPANSKTAWSQNPALIIRDYLLDNKYGLAEDVSNINSPALSIAQTICDQTINLSGSGNQKRYTCDGVLNTGNSIQSNIEKLLSSMAGKLTFSGGEFFILAGAYITPTITIDESTMVGALSIKTKQSRRSIYNGVKGVFLSEENNYNKADYPSVISSSYSAADGDPIYLDMPLPFTTNNIRAQRLAKLALLKSRKQTQITVPCNLAALKFKCGDTILLTNSKIGWSQKAFEVIGYSLSSFKDAIVVNVDAVETASDLYDWQSSDEIDYLTGGELDLYDGRTTVAPTSFVGTASTVINSDGAVIPRIVLTWTSSADVFVERYELQWSTDNAHWDSIDVTGNQFTISPVIAATTYYTRIRAINNIGVRSSWATANITAVGDTTAPAAPTAISATAGYKSISLAWTNPSNKDFSNIEVYRSTTRASRYSLVATVAGGWGAVAEFLNGGLNDSTAYYYKLKAVDYSGNKSAFTRAVNATTSVPAKTPRANQGYVYKTAASERQPATPRATSYNYKTGSFGGLTRGWQVDPPTVTGANGKYWASSYTVTEASYDGTQTIAFNRPFASHKFDGLVTFTNLNSELANAGVNLAGRKITTINGGLIKTGTIDAGVVRVSNIDATNIKTGTIDADRIEIDGKTITAGSKGIQIKDLGVTNAKISGAIQSNNYSARRRGWKVDKRGNAEFNDATFRGTLSAPRGTIGAVTLAKSGHIKSGQTAFDRGTGFFIGNVGSTPKFSIGKSNGPRLTWDGSRLKIYDSVSVVKAGNIPLVVSTKEINFNLTSWTIVKTITVAVSGTVKAKALFKASTESGTVHAAFRKNSLPYNFGATSTRAYKSWTTIEETFSVSPGNQIHVVIKNNGWQNSYGWLGSFGLYVNTGSGASITQE